MKKITDDNTIKRSSALIEDFIVDLSKNRNCSTTKYLRVSTLLEYGMATDDVPLRCLLDIVANELGHSKELVRQSLKRFFEDVWFAGNEPLTQNIIGTSISNSATAQVPDYKFCFISSVAYLKNIQIDSMRCKRGH